MPDIQYRRGRGGRPYERAKARIKELAEYCMKCGKAISSDYRWPHPNSVTVGHIIPLALGGQPLDPDNLQPECIRCNSGEGTAISQQLHGKHKTASYINNEW
jgi:5-methylcytosine-specific restriction endonuclease McrA